MQTGIYHVEAYKEHFEFSTLSNVRISPNSARLADLVLERVHVCGSVLVPRPPIAHLTHSDRTVTARSHTEEVFTAQVSNDGTYCIPLPTAQLYHLSASVSAREEEAGLALHPSKLAVELSTSPGRRSDKRVLCCSVVSSFSCCVLLLIALAPLPVWPR
jgi:hypothetical protein